MLSSRVRFTLTAVIVAVIAVFQATAHAQNHAPNPYRAVEGVWGKLPEGMSWGSTMKG